MIQIARNIAATAQQPLARSSVTFGAVVGPFASSCKLSVSQRLQCLPADIFVAMSLAVSQRGALQFGCNDGALGDYSFDFDTQGVSPRVNVGRCTRQQLAHKQHKYSGRAVVVAPFASLSSSLSVDAPRGTPMFTIASASESATASSSGWRGALTNLAAGATAGCAVEAALYPIDTVKTRLQAMIGGGGIKSLFEAGGGKGLYAGVWGNLAGVAPATAIFMAVYEPVKQAVARAAKSDAQFWAPVIAGMAAGTAASFIRVPTEVVKQRLQTKEFPGAITAIRSIMTKEGLRGMYAGYGAFMMRDLPFDAIEFLCYEQCKLAGSAFLKRDLNAAETSVIGAFAGGFTGVITTPLDVLKTRLMTQGASGRYKNLVDATLQIARTEGAGAFMSGWQPRLIWISLGGFVFFPVLEAAKKFYAPAQPTTH